MKTILFMDRLGNKLYLRPTQAAQLNNIIVLRRHGEEYQIHNDKLGVRKEYLALGGK